MSIFGKDFNPEVFAYDVGRVENPEQSLLAKSRAIIEDPSLAETMRKQNGTCVITTVLKGLLTGKPQNYDGSDNADPKGTSTYRHTKVVVGRWAQWEESDFAADLTGGEDFMENIEAQVADYWWGVRQGLIISILKGIFSMTSEAGKKFAAKHTYDVTGITNSSNQLGRMDMVSVNTCMQRACGDNKNKFELMICHSNVSTNLENMKLLSYLKYTDKDGTERDLTLGQINGRLVLVDDTMPYEEITVYTKTTDSALDESKTYYVKSSNEFVEVEKPVVGNISTYYERIDSFVQYTTYVLGYGAFSFTDVGAEVPCETERKPSKNGGTDLLYYRNRYCYAPYGISWTSENMSTNSPSDEELEDGSNWEIVHTTVNGVTTHLNDKVIHIARILSRG